MEDHGQGKKQNDLEVFNGVFANGGGFGVICIVSSSCICL